MKVPTVEQDHRSTLAQSLAFGTYVRLTSERSDGLCGGRVRSQIFQFRLWIKLSLGFRVGLYIRTRLNLRVGSGLVVSVAIKHTLLPKTQRT